jgi:hypothetical protein
VAFLLIELAAGEGPLMDPERTGQTPPAVAAAQAALQQALQHAGLEDPAATLRAIRLKAVENERAEPERPAHLWRADAVADCAASDCLGTLHDGFDRRMARVSEGFGGESQLWVAAVALIVAVGLQLDAVHLLKRLSIDDRFRATFAELAPVIDKQMEELKAGGTRAGSDGSQAGGDAQQTASGSSSGGTVGSDAGQAPASGTPAARGARCRQEGARTPAVLLTSDRTPRSRLSNSRWTPHASR